MAKTSLSLDISRILNDETISDDEKVKLYGNALRRYVNIRNEIPARATNELTIPPPSPPPPPRPAVNIPPPPLVNFMAPTLELDLTSLFNQRRSTEVAETSRAIATKLRKKFQVGSVLVTMDDIYTNPRASGSYGGIDMLRRYSHKPRKQVAKYLSTLCLLYTSPSPRD